MGFVLNPYDRCVANKMINDKQCTIVWYVDDNKLSHMDQKVLDDILEKMKVHFGDLTITKGRKHAFLGMNIEIREDGTVSYEMTDQLQEAIDAFGEKIDGHVTSPANRYLFDTREDTSILLNEDKRATFHKVSAKLLFITKRARPDIETVVAYLCTRVKAANEDDWKKLRRVLQWIKQTIHEKRIMGVDSLLDLYTWIDAAYAVHPNMRSHTGGCMSFGRGMVHCRSSKQKLNTKSSTEAELVGVSDYLPFNIWLTNFMEGQGYKFVSNKLQQDNQSAIRMEKNGRNSCTGNSRHKDIRYFFVKDRVDKDEIIIEYCPTELMIADYFTKALQGKAFKKMWNVIMGRTHINSLRSESHLNAPIKERVEKQVFGKVSENLNVLKDEPQRRREYDINIEKKEEKGKVIKWSDIVKGTKMNGGKEKIMSGRKKKI